MSRINFVKWNIVICIAVVAFGGCLKAREYFSTDRGAVRMNLVFPFGEGARVRNYLVVDGIAVDRGDTGRMVRKKLGAPSFRGLTMEGYQFYRYDQHEVEIYFYENRVVAWRKVDFKP